MRHEDSSEDNDSMIQCLLPFMKPSEIIAGI